jgi:hypothetical protein
MTQAKEKSTLEYIYNGLDWLDLGLAAAIIFYYSRLIMGLPSYVTEELISNPAQFINIAVENAGAIGIALVVASLFICTAFVLLSLELRRRKEASGVRTLGRLIWNGAWILMDVSFLVVIILFHLG